MMTEALGVLERRCEGLEKENKTLKATVKVGASTSGTGLDSLSSSNNTPVKALASSSNTTSISTTSLTLVTASASVSIDFANVDYGRLLEAQTQANIWRGLAVHRLTSSLQPLPTLSLRYSIVGEDSVDDDLTKRKNLYEKLDIARRVYFDARLVRASISVLDLISKRQPAYTAATNSAQYKSRPTDRVIKTLDEYRRDLLLAAI